MRFFKYIFATLAAYVIVCIFMVASLYFNVCTASLAWVLNIGSRPDLFVWADSGDTFFQDVSINDQPLNRDGFFNSEEVEALSDGEYFLFLINSKSGIMPPANVRDLFDLSDEKLASVLEGEIISNQKLEAGFRFDFIPVYVKLKTIALVDMAMLDVSYDKACHRDISFELLTSIESIAETLDRCRSH